MPVRLRKFPYLVQIEIVQKLNYPEVLNLSLTSVRMARIISNANFKNVAKMLYSQNSCALIAKIEEHHDRNKKIPIGSVIDGRFSECSFSTKLAHKKVSYECERDDNETFRYFFKPDANENFQKLFTHHLSKLFKQTTPIDLSVDFRTGFDISVVIEGVKGLTVLNEQELDHRCVQYIKSYSGLAHLKIMGWFTFDPVFSGIPSLFLEHANSLANPFLQNFDGQFIFLLNAEFSETELLAFIEQWKSGNKYQNLKDVRMVFKDERANFDTFATADRIARREVLEDNPSRMYSYARPGQPPQQYETNYFRDFHRNGDEKLASFDLNPFNFTFIVWD